MGAGAAALVGVSAVRVPAAPVSRRPGRAAGPHPRHACRPTSATPRAPGSWGCRRSRSWSRRSRCSPAPRGSARSSASGDAWRADELTPTGEHGVYRIGPSEFLWDFEANQLTRVLGIAAARLPRASDLLPPDLARRLLALAGHRPGHRAAVAPDRGPRRRGAAGHPDRPADDGGQRRHLGRSGDGAAVAGGGRGPHRAAAAHHGAAGGDRRAARPRAAAPSSRRRARATSPPRSSTSPGALKVLNAPPPPAQPRRPGPGRAAGHAAARASACTARDWPRSCSCRPAATSPSAPSTRPPPRAGSPSRCRRVARPASPRPCCRWPCAPAAGRARCCSARSTPPCWTARSPSCPGRRPA